MQRKSISRGRQTKQAKVEQVEQSEKKVLNKVKNTDELINKNNGYGIDGKNKDLSEVSLTSTNLKQLQIKSKQDQRLAAGIEGGAQDDTQKKSIDLQKDYRMQKVFQLKKVSQSAHILQGIQGQDVDWLRLGDVNLDQVEKQYVISDKGSLLFENFNLNSGNISTSVESQPSRVSLGYIKNILKDLIIVEGHEEQENFNISEGSLVQLDHSSRFFGAIIDIYGTVRQPIFAIRHLQYLIDIQNKKRPQIIIKNKKLISTDISRVQKDDEENNLSKIQAVDELAVGQEVVVPLAYACCLDLNIQDKKASDNVLRDITLSAPKENKGNVEVKEINNKVQVSVKANKPTSNKPGPNATLVHLNQDSQEKPKFQIINKQQQQQGLQQQNFSLAGSQFMNSTANMLNLPTILQQGLNYSQQVQNQKYQPSQVLNQISGPRAQQVLYEATTQNSQHSQQPQGQLLGSQNMGQIDNPQNQQNQLYLQMQKRAQVLQEEGLNKKAKITIIGSQQNTLGQKPQQHQQQYQPSFNYLTAKSIQGTQQPQSLIIGQGLHGSDTQVEKPYNSKPSYNQQQQLLNYRENGMQSKAQATLSYITPQIQQPNQYQQQQQPQQELQLSLPYHMQNEQRQAQPLYLQQSNQGDILRNGLAQNTISNQQQLIQHQYDGKVQLVVNNNNSQLPFKENLLTNYQGPINQTQDNGQAYKQQQHQNYQYVSNDQTYKQNQKVSQNHYSGSSYNNQYQQQGISQYSKPLLQVTPVNSQSNTIQQQFGNNQNAGPLKTFDQDRGQQYIQNGLSAFSSGQQNVLTNQQYLNNNQSYGIPKIQFQYQYQ